MWIGLYLVEHSILWGLAAFFCFRIFDIFKPGPIGEMDKMDGGIGVMMDDVVAGILTCFLCKACHIFLYEGFIINIGNELLEGKT